MAFDTRLRDWAVRLARERREALRLTVLNKTKSALSDLARAVGITEVFLFGSMCRPGAFREGSDVDVAVAGRKLDPPLALAFELS